jgi:hypothetical protein
VDDHSDRFRWEFIRVFGAPTGGNPEIPYYDSANQQAPDRKIIPVFLFHLSLLSSRRFKKFQ